MKLYNGRITHLEDLLFEGASGYNTLLNVMKDLTSLVESDNTGNLQVSLKVDGAPSFVFGMHPETKRWMVATKSFFNKEPKINYTIEDIDRNHPDHGLNKILKELFYNLPFSYKIVQGDFLFLHEELKQQTIGETDYITFKPNTIAYGVPVDSAIGRNILKSPIGFIYHTIYNGLTVESATLNTTQVDFTHLPHVWCRDASITINPVGVISEQKQHFRDCYNNVVSKQYGNLNALVRIIESKKYIQRSLYEYIFHCIKNNMVPCRTIFVEFVGDAYHAKANELKTEEGKQNKLSERAEILRELRSYTGWDELFNLWIVLHDFKTETLMPIFGHNHFSLESFLEKNGQYIPCKPEGYVLNNNEYTVKIVDRYEFTKANFENTRWN